MRREYSTLAFYGDIISARKRMMKELKAVIESNPQFQGRVDFPELNKSRLRRLINQRFYLAVFCLLSDFWNLLIYIQLSRDYLKLHQLQYNLISLWFSSFHSSDSLDNILVSYLYLYGCLQRADIISIYTAWTGSIFIVQILSQNQRSKHSSQIMSVPYLKINRLCKCQG